MGISFWGFLIAPALAAASPTDQSVDDLTGAVPFAAVEQDSFSDFAVMDEAAMADAAGGADAGVSIGALISNSATQTGGVSRVTTNGDTGQIANNSAANNSGITTIFNNTGNGVLFQSTVNVNIFLGESTPNP